MTDPKHAVLEMVQILKDNPEVATLEYDSKETGTHIKVQRIPPQPKETPPCKSQPSTSE